MTLKSSIPLCAIPLLLALSTSQALAQSVHECTADELSVVRGEQPGYWTASGQKAMVIYGVHYADYAWARHMIRPNQVDYVVAIKDTNRDGKPPYAYIWGQTLTGREIAGPWVHNHFGADSGRWACYHGTFSSRENLHQGGLKGSVDNAPEIPEVLLD